MHPQAITIRTKKLGVLIYDARLAKRRTIEECARAIGVTQETYQSFEAGSSAPSLPQLEMLAYSLDVPLDHFWSSSLLEDRSLPSIDLQRLMILRQRLIGAMLRQVRNNANLSPAELAQAAGITEDDLRAFELGEKEIPLPLLEALLAGAGSRVEDFFDKKGPVGAWQKGKKSVDKFQQLPATLQDFVGTAVNRPYVELALRLSELSVERLRAIAEGLLEITY